MANMYAIKCPKRDNGFFVGFKGIYGVKNLQCIKFNAANLNYPADILPFDF